jgi:hypothetical protein
VLLRPEKTVSLREARLRRLAERIRALSGKDEEALRHAREITALRRAAAATLFQTCAGFVHDVNALVANPELTLDPTEFDQDRFQEDTTNLIQINLRGRILQVSYQATIELLSTEDFRIPYTLEGTIRAFSQELLDKDMIEEQLIFYTVEKNNHFWRFFDARTYRSGPFDQEYLISLFDQLL